MTLPDTFSYLIVRSEGARAPIGSPHSPQSHAPTWPRALHTRLQLQRSSSRTSSSRAAHAGSSIPEHGHRRRTQQRVLEGRKFESTPHRLGRAHGVGRGHGAHAARRRWRACRAARARAVRRAARPELLGHPATMGNSAGQGRGGGSTCGGTRIGKGGAAQRKIARRVGANASAAGLAGAGRADTHPRHTHRVERLHEEIIGGQAGSW